MGILFDVINNYFKGFSLGEWTTILGLLRVRPLNGDALKEQLPDVDL